MGRFVKSQAKWWDPAALTARRAGLAARNRIRKAVAACFEESGFIEVETPALQISPGLEPHLVAFETRLEGPGGAGPPKPRYLNTSPEFAMKKLLAGGLPMIWQAARVFRNAEGSPTHSPEFTMIEWYRANAGYNELIADATRLLRAAAGSVEASLLTHHDNDCDPFAEPEVVTVEDVFQRECGIDLRALVEGDPNDPSPGPFAEAARALGIRVAEDDRWDDIFFRIFAERIEPKLGTGRPTFLVDYPICMAALSRAKPEDPMLAERVELYVSGLELANGFGELTDPREQRRRFDADMALKQALYGRSYPIDEGFMDALEQMPPAAGMALGFDRLVMLVTGARDIRDVLWAWVE